MSSNPIYDQLISGSIDLDKTDYLKRDAMMCGVAYGEIDVERLRHAGPDQGFDAERGTWVTLREAGIVDPAKVLRCALVNAGSLAATVLTTDALVVDDTPQGDAA